MVCASARPGAILARTERLLVRRFLVSDGEGLHAVLSRAEAVHFEPYGTLDRATCAVLARERSTDDRFWAVCRADDGAFVGTLYLAATDDPAWATYTLGFVFHPDHWGHGYATEAATALLDHCFTERGAHRVIARCNPRNTASRRLLARLGMRREALHLSAAGFEVDPTGNRVWHDVEVHAVLDTEWAGARP